MEKVLFKRDQWKLIQASLADEEQNYALSLLHFSSDKLYSSNGKILVAVDRDEIGSKDIKPGAYMLVSIGRPTGAFIEVIVEPAEGVSAPDFATYMAPAVPTSCWLQLERPKGKNKEDAMRLLTRAVLAIKKETGANINIYFLEVLTLLEADQWTLHRQADDSKPSKAIRLSALGGKVNVTICAFTK